MSDQAAKEMKADWTEEQQAAYAEKQTGKVVRGFRIRPEHSYNAPDLCLSTSGQGISMSTPFGGLAKASCAALIVYGRAVLAACWH